MPLKDQRENTEGAEKEDGRGMLRHYKYFSGLSARTISASIPR
jgi:hypothetical protein